MMNNLVPLPYSRVAVQHLETDIDEIAIRTFLHHKEVWFETDRPQPFIIDVFDLTPPEPPRLLDMARRVLAHRRTSLSRDLMRT